MSYRRLIRPLLFRCDPERAHRLGIRGLSEIGRRPWLAKWLQPGAIARDPALAIEIAGIRFPNPLGVAAGLDKNGEAVEGLAALGFGAVEVGSVSAEPSEGNPRPRLLRLPADEAVLVHYGVPNDGIAVVRQRLAQARCPVPVGLNLVETNRGGDPPSAAEVIDEFRRTAASARGVCDYLMLNLNCPNSGAGSSPLSEPKHLQELLSALSELEDLPPIFLKPTATEEAETVDKLLEAVDPFPIVRGFAFNVAAAKPPTLKSPARLWRERPGVICGPPLRESMRRTLRAWAHRADRRRYCLIASGGIGDAEDAYERICQGASMLQLYTALIYQGPKIVPNVLAGIRDRLRRDGFRCLSEAVGCRVGAPRPSAAPLPPTTSP